MGFAIISSVHTPASISLIGDYFEHENRSKANSIYVAAISFGIGLANLTSLINNTFGWRLCSLIVSLIGVALSLFGLTIYEPERTDDRGNFIHMETEIALSKAETMSERTSQRAKSERMRTRVLQDLRMQSVMKVKDINEESKDHPNFKSEIPRESETIGKCFICWFYIRST